jgi:hypothetical protein
MTSHHPIRHPIRTMFNSLANANFGGPLGDAYTTVVTCIDWGALDIEFMGRVVIGLASLPEALRDAADVVDDADLDSDEGERAISAAEMLRAASVLDGLREAAEELSE